MRTYGGTRSRLLAPLLALVLAAFAAPVAQAAQGTLEIVSRGPAKGTLSLPARVAVDYRRRPELRTPNPFVLLAVSQRGTTTYSVAKPPGSRDGDWTYGYSDEYLPAGRSTVQVLTEGPLRMRVPVSGFSGTRRLNLDGRVGGNVVVRELVPDSTGVVENAIPWEVPRSGGVLLHGYVRRADLFLSSVEDHCSWGDQGGCGAYSVVPGPWAREWSVLHPISGVERYFRSGTAYAFSADVAVGLGTVTHYVLVLPTA